LVGIHMCHLFGSKFSRPNHDQKKKQWNLKCEDCWYSVFEWWNFWRGKCLLFKDVSFPTTLASCGKCCDHINF